MVVFRETPVFEGQMHVLRALAILLVVLSYSLQGLVQDTSTIAVQQIILSFHMPLFFFVCGFLRQKLLTADRTHYGITLRGHFVGLMVPYMFCTSLAVAADIFWPAIFFFDRPPTVADLTCVALIKPSFHPVASLWFLYVQFLLEWVFLTMTKVIRINFSRRACVAAATVCLASLHFFWPYITVYFGLDLVARFAIFFFLGLLLGRQYGHISRPLKQWKIILLPLPLMFLGYIDLQFIPAAGLLYAVVGISTMWLISGFIEQHLHKITPAFYAIADYSFDIYFYCCFAMVTVRHALTYLTSLSEPFLTVGTFIGGILLPMLLSHLVLQRVRWLRLIALGDIRATSASPFPTQAR